MYKQIIKLFVGNDVLFVNSIKIKKIVIFFTPGRSNLFRSLIDAVPIHFLTRLRPDILKVSE